MSLQAWKVTLSAWDAMLDSDLFAFGHVNAHHQQSAWVAEGSQNYRLLARYFIEDKVNARNEAKILRCIPPEKYLLEQSRYTPELNH